MMMLVKAVNHSALDSDGGSAPESMYDLGGHLTMLCIPVNRCIFFISFFLGNSNI